MSFNNNMNNDDDDDDDDDSTNMEFYSLTSTDDGWNSYATVEEIMSESDLSEPPPTLNRTKHETEISLNEGATSVVETTQDSQTSDDFMSSQIFDMDESQTTHINKPIGDYRVKFNKCLNFFNQLSAKQKFPILPSPSTPINTHFNKKIPSNKSTNTFIMTNAVSTQTDDDNDDDDEDGDNIGIVNSENHFCTALAITIDHESGKHFTAESCGSNYILAAKQACIESLLLTFNSLNPYQVIDLSIKCSNPPPFVLDAPICSYVPSCTPPDNTSPTTSQSINSQQICEESPSISNYPISDFIREPHNISETHSEYNFVNNLQIVQETEDPQLELHDSFLESQLIQIIDDAHITSESLLNSQLVQINGEPHTTESLLNSQFVKISGEPQSTTSSSSTSLLPDSPYSSKIYVATPVIHNTPIQYNGSNSTEPSHPMFLHTSTPLPTPLRRTFSSVTKQQFPSTSLRSPNDCGHFLTTNPPNNSNSNTHDNKRIYLSLYNLTTTSLFTPQTPQTAYNPTNTFFNNSTSYCSLRETDIDTGKQDTYSFFTETDLDEFSAPNKTRSLSAVNNQPSLSQPSCVVFDDGLLNASYPQHSSNLAMRLMQSAHSQAQLRVARSITKLNVPQWLDSIDLSEEQKKYSEVKTAPTTPHNSVKSIKTSSLRHRHLPSFSQRTISSTEHRSATVPSSLKLNQTFPLSTSTKTTFLPSSKYASKSTTKIKPITETKARSVLSVNKIQPQSSCIDPKHRIQELSQEFLASVHLEPYCNFREQSRHADEYLGRVCCRILCSNLISDTARMVLCDYCTAVYCCYTCSSLDRVSHTICCDRALYILWLEHCITSLSASQLSFLFDIFQLGWTQLDNGIIIWRVDEIKRVDPPLYSSHTDQLEMIRQKITQNKFPLSIISLPKSSKVPSHITKFLNTPPQNSLPLFSKSTTNSSMQSPNLIPRQFSNSIKQPKPNLITQKYPNSILQSPSKSPMTQRSTNSILQPNQNSITKTPSPKHSIQSQTTKYRAPAVPQNSSSSHLSIENRHNIVMSIHKNMREIGMNVELNYPGIAQLLDEYVVHGTLFESQQLFLPGSNSLVTIKPDCSDVQVTKLL